MMQPNTPVATRFAAAAEALTADPTLTGLSDDETSLLRYLRYDDADADAAAGRARMLRAAAKLRRLFLLPVPDAPGLVFFGGEADPAIVSTELAGMPAGNLAGSGVTPRRAFEACVGEAIEYLSQFVQTGDRIEQGMSTDRSAQHGPAAKRFITDVLAARDIDPARLISWVPVLNITTGATAWFPADLCLRRPAAVRDFDPPLRLSTGCAAGVTFDAAALRGALELIERDAAALWWRGGRRGRAIAADSEVGRAATELLAELRQGKQERRTWLLDITTDLDIPAVAAVSSGADGFGFAFGLGARLTLVDAACAAIFEMCQVELGPHVVAAKRRESGDDALQEGDLRHLRRTTLIDTRLCPLLQPEGLSGAGPSAIPADPAAALRCIAERLTEHGITTFLLDLTRPDFDVPVVRVIAPGLQLEPSQIVSDRLALAIRETGGGTMHTGGLSLL